MPDFVECEGEIILPGRRREDQPESAALVEDVARVELGRTETTQEVLELIDRLDRSRRVVDRWRQRLDGDIDEKPDRILWVLVKGSLVLKMDGADERVLRRRRSRAMNTEENRTFDQRVADRAGHHNRPARLSGQRDKEIRRRAPRWSGACRNTSPFGSRDRPALCCFRRDERRRARRPGGTCRL